MGPNRLLQTDWQKKASDSALTLKAAGTSSIRIDKDIQPEDLLKYGLILSL